MTFILLFLSLFSCNKSNVGVFSSVSEVKTHLPLTKDYFEIIFIPSYLKFGPQEESPNNYLISGSLKTSHGTLTKTEVIEIMNEACKNRCEILQVSENAEDSSLWNYQLTLQGKEKFELIILSGVVSEEGLSTKKLAKVLYEYQDYVLPPISSGESFFSFIPQTATYVNDVSSGKMMLPLEVHPQDVFVNLAQLNALEKPGGCEGLIFTKENNIILAQLPMVSMDQTCSFSIPEKSVDGVGSNESLYKNYGTNFILSFQGISLQPNFPIVVPTSFNITLTPFAVNAQKAFINVTSPYALNVNTFINALVLNGCADPQLSEGASGTMTGFSFSLKMENNLCQIVLTSGIFNINNSLNNAVLTNVLAVTQTQVVEPSSTVIDTIVNNTVNTTNTTTLNNNVTFVIHPSIPTIICPPVVPSSPVNPTPIDDSSIENNTPEEQIETPVVDDTTTQPIVCNMTQEEEYALKVLLTKFPQLSCTSKKLNEVELEAKYGYWGQSADVVSPSYFISSNYNLINSKFTNNFYQPGNGWSSMAQEQRNLLKSYVIQNNTPVETANDLYNIFVQMNNNPILIDNNYFQNSKMLPTSDEVAKGSTYGLSPIDLITSFPPVVNNFINAELKLLTVLTTYAVQSDSNYMGPQQGTFSPTSLSKSLLKFKIKNAQCPALISLMSVKVGRQQVLSGGSGGNRFEYDRHTLYGGRAFVYIPEGYLNSSNCTQSVSSGNLIPVNQPYDIEGYTRELPPPGGLNSSNVQLLQGPYTPHNAGALIFKTATYLP